MKEELKALPRSVTGKVLFTGFVVLLLLIPLGMIEGLVHERARHYDAARDDIGRSWGLAQTIGGPILVLPFAHTRYVNGQTVTVTDELYLLPERLVIEGRADAEQRRRGIYEVPVYTARLRVSGRLPEVALGSEYNDPQIRWEQAVIALPLADARSVREPIVFTAGGGTAAFEAGGARVAGFGPLLVAPYAALSSGPLPTPRDFSFDLVIGGTEGLRFLPLGDETRIAVSSTWPSPSFVGASLPTSRTVDAGGFTAEWSVLDLGRGYPASWTRSGTAPTIQLSSFGVDLITPVGIHEAALRATKYGVLIVGLTFVAFFLFELFAPLRLHALQYLLIGLANCVFYLLLLALAEHVGFGLAYATSAVAATALVASYSSAILRSLRRAAPVGTLLAALYGYLYVTLKAEDYALLFGALGVFASLAAFMYLTRHLDWFTATFTPPSPDRAPPQHHA